MQTLASHVAWSSCLCVLNLIQDIAYSPEGRSDAASGYQSTVVVVVVVVNA